MKTFRGIIIHNPANSSTIPPILEGTHDTVLCAFEICSTIFTGLSFTSACLLGLDVFKVSSVESLFVNYGPCSIFRRVSGRWNILSCKNNCQQNTIRKTRYVTCGKILWQNVVFKLIHG